MNILLADELLRPGLQARPLVPQGELVLRRSPPRPPCSCRPAAPPRKSAGACWQGAVLHVGPLPVRQQELPHHQSPQKEAEQGGEKSRVSFCHDHPPPLRTGNTGRGCSCRPPDRRCTPPGTASHQNRGAAMPPARSGQALPTAAWPRVVEASTRARQRHGVAAQPV